MKPFDLAKALKGDKVVTRNGHEVSEIVKFNVSSRFCVVGVTNGYIEHWDENGWHGYMNDRKYDYDLFMAPVKRQEWRALYKSASNITGYKVGNFSYETEKDALKSKGIALYGNNFIKAILIREWEE